MEERVGREERVEQEMLRVARAEYERFQESLRQSTAGQELQALPSTSPVSGYWYPQVLPTHVDLLKRAFANGALEWIARQYGAESLPSIYWFTDPDGEDWKLLHDYGEYPLACLRTDRRVQGWYSPEPKPAIWLKTSLESRDLIRTTLHEFVHFMGITDEEYADRFAVAFTKTYYLEAMAMIRGWDWTDSGGWTPA